MKHDRQKMAQRKDVPTKFKNGWLDELDGRMALAQSMRERFKEFARDVGGSETLSYAQRSLIERALWLEYWLANQERALAYGQKFDVAKWIQGANSLQGLMYKLGLERRQTEVVTLTDYIESKGT
jgi:hypothetical protein